MKLEQISVSNVGLLSGREKKREIGMARKRAENREGSLGFPGFVNPEFTKDREGTDNGNLVKLSACEIIEAQLRSEESAHLIRGTENGASDEASDQEGASMQLIPVRHKVSTELYVDRVGPLPVIPGHKHILSDLCMSPRYHESVPMISIKGWDFPIDHMDGILELNTHLAVRPAEFELAQDGVEYCSHVVGLGKQSVPSSTEG
ncbi:uncharacterized protein TNCV_2314961 [Trichonephila clavipes]|nr:uncharacterized protein TNCV_2314961 [Trichonephila clavipes]